MNSLGGQRAFLYARVSLVEMQPENQLNALRDFCRVRNIAIVGEYIDRVSGKSQDRPSLRKLLSRLSDDDADLMIAFALDRVGRSVSHVIKLVEDLRNKGKGLIVLRENLDLRVGNAQSDLLLCVFSALAQFEVSLLSQRTKEALRVAQLSGTKLGRPIKLTSEVRREILRLRSGGMGVREISRRIPDISRASIQNAIRCDANQKRTYGK